MLITLLITYSLFRGIQSHPSSGYFTIVAPAIVRSNSEYYISVSLDAFSQTCGFNISLEVSDGTTDKYIGTIAVEVEPGTSKMVKMDIPKLYYGYSILKVKGYRGIISAHTYHIAIEAHHYTTFIQTDKVKYRPGEIMQFRVIFVDYLTRPAQINEVIDVHIYMYTYDDHKNLIRSFTNINPVQGVFKGDLQLSEHLVLGKWVIEVRIGGDILENLFFEVARYELPKFSVEIDTKENVSVKEKYIVIKVNTSYTYGQPVIGNLTIVLSCFYVVAGYKQESKSEELNYGPIQILDYKVDFNITDYTFEDPGIYVCTATATVTESLTGQFRSATTDIIIHSQPYKVKLAVPSFFKLDDFINITVSVTDLQDNLILDTKNPILITIESLEDPFFNLDEMPVTEQRTVFLNNFGVGEISLIMPTNATFVKYQATAKYLDYITSPKTLKRKFDEFLKIRILTEKPEVGKELLIELKSADPFDYFIYEIVSRGVLIQSQRISIPENVTTHIFSINLTYSMVPKITLFVHHIIEEIFRSQLKDIRIKWDFQNSINIISENEVLPGALVSLNITTDEGSYVGLMGTDVSLLLQHDYRTTLTEDSIYIKLNKYDSIYIDEQIHPGAIAGLVTFSNARNKAGRTIGKPSFRDRFYTPVLEHKRFDMNSYKRSRIRKLFSESWMFADFKRTTEDGLKLHATIPDTITSWAITGFSLNPNTGLTLTKNATKIKVFQPFFISMDLPSLFKNGEIIETPVYVFNYLDQDLETDVTISNADGRLEFLENLGSESSAQMNRTFSKIISANGSEKFVFLIRPKSCGKYNITVQAVSQMASDIVVKTLTVISDGVPYSVSKTYLLHHVEESQAREDEILVEIPENAISDSKSIRLSVVGDSFGPLMWSLQESVRIPFGNSENNMRYFVSNLLVVKYLKTLNHSNPSLENKAKLYMELGYQTQLTFNHIDGSFSLFDRALERTGDIWITAYTIWALQQAKNFIQLEVSVIERGLNYLELKQARNGGFNSERGVEEDAFLTAFAILAFQVDTESQNRYADVITKGLSYLYNILDVLEKPIPTAISTYALVLGKHKSSPELLAKLSPQTKLTSKQLQWTKPDTLQSRLETTTYSFMGLLELEGISPEALYLILQSLISVGDDDKRTSTYMLALEAMIKFANRFDIKSNNLNIQYDDGRGESGNIQVNSSNMHVLQQVDLNRTSQSIKLRTTGKGFALVSINYKYNIISENQSSSNYQTNVTVNKLTEWTLSLDICVAQQQLECKSNLTILEVNIPSGYKVYEDSFDRITENNEQVKSIELIENRQSVRMYLENISQNGTCIQLGATKTIVVFNSIPISVVVYDAEA